MEVSGLKFDASISVLLST